MLKFNRFVFGGALLILGTLASLLFLAPGPPPVSVHGVRQVVSRVIPRTWFYPRGNIVARDLLALGGHFHGMALLWPGPTVVGATHLGIFLSGDGGVSWQLLDADFSVHGVGRIVASRDGKVLVVEGEGIGLKRSEDGGATWTPIHRGLPPHDVTALAIDPAAADHLLVWIGDSLARSDDGGRHWVVLSPRTPPPRVHSLAFHPTRRERLYAGTERGVWGSRDGGLTWSPPSPGAPAAPVLSLAVPPGHPDLLLAGTAEGPFLGVLDLSRWRPLPDPPKNLEPIVAFAFGFRQQATVFAMTHQGQVVTHPLQDLLSPSEGAAGWTALDLEVTAHPCLDSRYGEFGFDPC
jgi:hypothetical protein